MISKYGKIIWILILAMFIGSTAFFSRVFSYDNLMTHPSLTDNIARIYNADNSQKLTSQEINWLKQGSIEEDKAPRWMNHFYNPARNEGLWSFSSAKDWSQSPNLQKIYFKSLGDQSWQKAIDSYTSGDKKEAFIALGHVLHLLEDMTVPAHSRLDAHPSYQEYEDLLKTNIGSRVDLLLAQSGTDIHLSGDPYEKWVEHNIGSNMGFGPSLSNAIDLNNVFDKLAKYSSENFFSKDTIKKEELIGENIVDKKLNGFDFQCIEKIIDMKKICIVFYKESKFGREDYLLDLKENISVHSDYYNLLAPKAVSYGAGVIKLFFEEAEKKKKEQEEKSWWQKIKEKADNWLDEISGSLYAGFDPNLVVSESPALSGTQPSEAPLPSSLSATSAKKISVEAIVAQEKIETELPADAISAQEKIGGDIKEESFPDDKKIPPEIIEEKNPDDVQLPSGGNQASSDQVQADNSAPQTSITSHPSTVMASTTAIFIFESSEAPSTFICILDNGSSTPCVSPKEYSSLDEGSHVFKVNAIDATGNQDQTPAEYSWTVDTEPLQITGIFSAVGRTSVLISWTASEPGVFQLEYGTSSSYGFFSATTSASSFNLDLLEINTSYHFRILGNDNAGNATSSPDNIFTTTAQAENVVISEIQIEGATANDEFIELYNPTDNPINIFGWKLARRTATATSSYSNLVSSFPSISIEPHSFLLVAHPTDYDGLVPADVVYSSDSYHVAPDNAVLLYSDEGETIVDMVGFGAANTFEGVTIANPAANQSVERKSSATSTAVRLFSEDHKWLGNGYDSDNNSQDLVLQSNPSSQNSLMLTEPRTSFPVLMNSAWPTWQGNLIRNGISGVSSLSTSTMAVKWTATTTATHEFMSLPTLDDSGNIYIGRADGLAKYSSSGNFLWLNSLGGTYLAPLLLSDGTVVVRVSGALRAFSQDGQLKWGFPLFGTTGANAQLAILSNGTIITQAAEKIYAINQDGTSKWMFDPGRDLDTSNYSTAFTLDSTDNLYFGIDKYLYALSPSGNLLWETNLGSNYSSIVLDDFGQLYVSVGNIAPGGGFCALDATNGSIQWCDYGYTNTKSEFAPIIDSSGRVYSIMFYGNGNKKIQQYNGTNTPIWLSSNVTSDLAAPVLAADDKIYLADQRTIKIFDAASGSLVFIFNSPDGRNLNELFGAIGSNGIIYTANGYTLYAIGDS